VLCGGSVDNQSQKEKIQIISKHFQIIIKNERKKKSNSSELICITRLVWVVVVS
jgi:hypothetical protein